MADQGGDADEHQLIEQIRNRWAQERESTAMTMASHIVNLAQAFERESSIYAALTDGVILTDASGIIHRVNDAIASLTGRDASSLINTPLADLIEDGTQLDADVLPAILRDNSVRGLLFQLHREAGPPIPVSVNASVLRRPHLHARVDLVFFTRDMREAQRRIAAEANAEAERRKADEITAALADLENANRELAKSRERLLHSDRLAAIGQMAASLAHEVNNPAAFVVANLTLMQEVVEQLKQQLMEPASAPAIPSSRSSQFEGALEQLGEMLSENLYGMNRIRTLMNDLRMFSRVDRTSVSWVNINDLVDISCNMVRNELRHRGKLIKDLGDVPKIPADAGRLAQVLVNLLVNAAHAIREGSAESNEIRIATRLEDASIIVTVADTGCGMTPVVLERIFEPFFTTKGRRQGTGLGLSLSAEIVRSHSGEIRVESVPGKGTRFEIVVPLKTGLVVEPKQPARRSPQLGKPISARVLVIDDEPLIAKSMQRMLSQHGEVIVRNNGSDALELLRVDRNFDVIICDVMMPDIDGPQVYAALRELAPGMEDRVLFCSGGAFTARTYEFLESIGNRCLDKPVDVDVLQSAIASVRSVAPDAPSDDR